jgi:hypothetical protein
MTTVTKSQRDSLLTEAKRLGRTVTETDGGVFVLADIQNQQWAGQEVGKGTYFKVNETSS